MLTVTYLVMWINKDFVNNFKRENVDHLKKNLDWILYLYKDENIDQFIDYLAVFIDEK